MRGIFRQRPDHPFVALRQAVLAGDRTSSLPFAPEPAQSATPADAATVVLDQIERHGIGLVQLDQCMTNAEFRAFGDVLGRAQPERSPDVRARVEDQVILNLVTDSGPTGDPARQPFGANPLSLHSESSGAPLSAQPRYIVLMCLSAGADSESGKTILVPMSAAHDSLDQSARTLLATTSYDLATTSYDLDGHPPAILRSVGGRPVFCFRDFQDTPLRWKSTSSVETSAVDAALSQLCVAMYGATVYGLTWSAGLLAVIDNTCYFHGRTTTPTPRRGNARHLKRMRLTTHADRR